MYQNSRQSILKAYPFEQSQVNDWVNEMRNIWLTIFDTGGIIESVAERGLIPNLFAVDSQVFADPFATIGKGQRALHVESTFHLLVFTHALDGLRWSIHHVILRRHRRRNTGGELLNQDLLLAFDAFGVAPHALLGFKIVVN